MNLGMDAWCRGENGESPSLFVYIFLTIIYCNIKSRQNKKNSKFE